MNSIVQNFIHRIGRLVLLDRAADPTAPGEIQRNATHIKVYSGGAVRNLSDIAAGGTAPATADYLVGSAHPDLTAEIVVGLTPGGELGGTWAAPTVDPTHSGSAHHAQLHAAAHLTGAGDPVAPASLTAAGIVELATTAEINTGTDATRAVPIDQFVASNRNVRYLLIRVLEAATNMAVANVVGGDLELPFTGAITEIGAYVDTAGVTGLATIDVNLNGVTILSTKITIDSAEKSSRTAATPPVLSVTAVTVGDLITVDVDGIQTTIAKGLTIRLGIRQT